MIRLEDFLNTVYGVTSVDYGPGVGGDAEQVLDVNRWLHYIL